MISRGLRKSASHHHPVSPTDRPVANDAVNIKPLLPAVDQLFRYRDGKLVDSFGKLETSVFPASVVVVTAAFGSGLAILPV